MATHLLFATHPTKYGSSIHSVLEDAKVPEADRPDPKLKGGTPATLFLPAPIDGIRLGVVIWDNLIIITQPEWNSYSQAWQPGIHLNYQGNWAKTAFIENEPCPVVLRLLSTTAQPRPPMALPKDVPLSYEGPQVRITMDRHWDHSTYERTSHDSVPYVYLEMEAEVPSLGMSNRFWLPCTFPTAGPCVTAEFLDNPSDGVRFTSRFYGQEYTWTSHLQARVVNSGRGYSSNYRSFHNNPLQTVVEAVSKGTLGPTPEEWWSKFLILNRTGTDDDERLAATLKHKTVAPVLVELANKFPTEYLFFRWLKDGKTWDKHCNNVLLASFLKETAPKGVAAVQQGLRTAMTSFGEVSASTSYDEKRPVWGSAMREFCRLLPGASDKVQAEEAKQDWTKRKGNGNQADGLGVTAEQYPLLRAAIESGEVPLSIFHQPDKTPVNREFLIWEEALGQPGWKDVVYEIVKDAGRRSTYEKDITPYLAFCLYKLPAYLDRHAPAPKGTPKASARWKCQIKYVESTSAEIETNENGTVTTRSTFTPIVDNETRIVTVPYVAVVVGGVRTQWCYAKHYHLFERGFTDPISGGIVARDYEPKLNGRDDYGLMFYTLIGTTTATGYPTFLIIFERLKAKTRVHFHRVRPQRIKDGIKTPACQLVEACYQYMAGNVPAKEITAQQGDMIYIHYGALDQSPLDQKAKVGDPRVSAALGFESHRHISVSGETIELHPNQAKQPANRLGFMRVPLGGMAVRHPEHDDIEHLNEGWYEIRRCKSWEANPTAIWSLTID